MKLFKFFAAFLSAFTICFSPLAEALSKAQSQKELVNQFLKGSGLTTKKMTVAEFWRSVRHVYPKHIQRKMDLWIAKNRDQMMPTVDASTFKDSEGREQVRVTFSRDGQSLTMATNGDDDNFLKVNGVSFSRKEVRDPMAMGNKLMAKDAKLKKQILASKKMPLIRKKLVLDGDEFSKLTVYQKAEYLIRLRQTMMAAQKVYTAKYGNSALEEFNKKYEWVQRLLFGEEAEAASKYVGKRCVVAGYISIYGENDSCGGNQKGAANLKSQMNTYQATCESPNDVPCNPLVYGFKSGSTAFCVSRAQNQIKYATKICNQQSPIDTLEQKQKLIESFLERKGKKVVLKFENGKLSKEQLKLVRDEYLNDLNGLIAEGSSLCHEDQEFIKIQEKREEQKSACDALLVRAFDLQEFGGTPVPEVPEEPIPEPVPVDDCSDKPGSQKAGDGECVCTEGTQEKSDENGTFCDPIVGPETATPEGPVEKECTGFFCNMSWLLPVGLIAGVGLLAWWLLKDKGVSNPTPVEPTPPACTVTSTEDCKLPVICTPPQIIINGVCSDPAPPVPPIVIVPPEDGTLVDDRTGGGIRAKARGAK